VGGNTSIGDDFPSSGTSAVGLGTFIYRTVLFRTWVLVTCPGQAAQVLGYYEWGFTYLFEVGQGGVVTNAAKPQGQTPPAPPGGWPANLPETKTPTWVPQSNAPAQATADYNNVFP